MKNILICICVIIFSLLKAQESNFLAFDYKSGKISNDAFNTLQNGLLQVANAEISNQAIIRIYPTIKKSSVLQIEGMESKTLGSAKLNVRIYNSITQLDTLLTFKHDITGTNEKELDKELINKALDNQSFVKSFNSAFLLLLANSKIDCNNYKVKLTEFETDKDFDKAINAIAILELNRICKAELKPQIEHILTEYNKTQCESTIHQCKILIANGNKESISKATRLLLMAPPTPECRVELLTIINDLNSKTNLNSKEKGKLSSYKIAIQNSNYDSWYRIILDN